MVVEIINEEAIAKYLFYYFKILGLAPMRVNEIKTNLFVHSKSGTAYEVFLFVALLILNAYSIDYFYRHYDMAHRNQFEKTFNSLQDSLTLSTASLTVLAFTFHQNKAVMIANKIYHISRSAMLIDFHAYQKIPLASRVLTIFVIISVSWCAMTTTVCMYGISYVSNAAPLYISNIIAVSIILQYCAVLRYLEKLFTFVNDELSTNSKFIRVESTHLKSNALDPISRVYMSLREVSRSVSEFYSPLMLLSVLNIFLGCISSTYYIIKPFVFEEKRLPSLFVAHCLTLGLLYSLLLVTLTKCVTATVHESKKTGEIVSSYLMTCKNLEIARKLDQFSNYLILNKVKFTVFKLFSLDQSLLMSIIGSTTTYLVIILQLQDN